MENRISLKHVETRNNGIPQTRTCLWWLLQVMVCQSSNPHWATRLLVQLNHPCMLYRCRRVLTELHHPLSGQDTRKGIPSCCAAQLGQTHGLPDFSPFIQLQELWDQDRLVHLWYQGWVECHVSGILSSYHQG